MTSVNVCILVLDPPQSISGASILLVLEDAKKNHHDGLRQPGGSLAFEFPIQVKPQKDSPDPDFGGPYVNGPRGERFIYLTWVWDGPGQVGRFGRIKVPLKAITWELIEKTAGGVLTARISGTGKDGSPACATVKLLDEGWTV